MNKHRFRLSLLALCFLAWFGLALGCEQESIDPNQGLSGGVHLRKLAEVSTPESCWAACCAEPRCDLALMAYAAANVNPQCSLVSCKSGGPDACVLQPSSEFKVYRKKVKEEADGVKPTHFVPLLDHHEPRINVSSNIRCRQQKKVGPCRASFPRFYYDVANQTCYPFSYGGCNGNANIFGTQEECESVCSGVTGTVLPDESTPTPPQHAAKAPRMALSFDTKRSEDAEGLIESQPASTESVHLQERGMSADEYAEYCKAEPLVGLCRASFKHWYYNSRTGNCEPFIYGGCKGNKNNYVSKESCVDKCIVSVQQSSKKSSDDDGVSKEYKDQCMATPDPGPCRAAFPKFYYDKNTGTCQSFVYGGCHGNQNRYGTIVECMTRCSQDGSFDGRGKPRNRWTAAFFLIITLAAISALLLVTLVLISLRRHRLSGHSPSVSDKEELLPDPDEQSSVESLTIPESPKPSEV